MPRFQTQLQDPDEFMKSQQTLQDPDEFMASQSQAPESDPKAYRVSSPLQEGANMMGEQARNVVKGLVSPITGIPNMLKGAYEAGKQTISGGGTSKAQELVAGTIKGITAPFTSTARGIGALVAPDKVEGPSDEEWAEGAQGAGAMLGGELVGKGIEAVKPRFNSMVKAGVPEVKAAAKAIGEKVPLAERWSRRQKERPLPFQSETPETHVRRALGIDAEADVNKGLEAWKTYEDETGVKIHNADEAQKAIDHTVDKHTKGVEKEIEPIRETPVKGSAKYAAEAEIDNLSADMTVEERSAEVDKIRKKYANEPDMTAGKLNEKIKALNNKLSPFYKKNSMGQLTSEEMSRWAEMKARRTAMSDMLSKSLEDYRGPGGADALKEHRANIASQIDLQSGLESKAKKAKVERGTKRTVRETLGLSKGRTIDKEIADAMRKQRESAAPIQTQKPTADAKTPTAGKPAAKQPKPPVAVDTGNGDKFTPQSVKGEQQALGADTFAPPQSTPWDDPFQPGRRAKLWDTMQEAQDARQGVNQPGEQGTLPMTQTPQGEAALFEANPKEPTPAGVNQSPVEGDTYGYAEKGTEFPKSPLNAPAANQPPVIAASLANQTLPQAPGQLPMGEAVPRGGNVYDSQFVETPTFSDQGPAAPPSDPFNLEKNRRVSGDIADEMGEKALNAAPEAKQIEAPKGPAQATPGTTQAMGPGTEGAPIEADPRLPQVYQEAPVDPRGPAAPGGQMGPGYQQPGEQTRTATPQTPETVEGAKRRIDANTQRLAAILKREHPGLDDYYATTMARDIIDGNNKGPVDFNAPEPSAAPQANPAVPSQAKPVEAAASPQGFLSFRKDFLGQNPGVDPNAVRPIFEVKVKGVPVEQAIKGLKPEVADQVKRLLKPAAGGSAFGGGGGGETVLPL